MPGHFAKFRAAKCAGMIFFSEILIRFGACFSARPKFRAAEPDICLYLAAISGVIAEVSTASPPSAAARRELCAAVCFRRLNVRLAGSLKKHRFIFRGRYGSRRCRGHSYSAALT
jgi:hypothetical protein